MEGRVRNHELIEKVMRLVGEFDRTVANPPEMRNFLGLKGWENVVY
ncbi:MAG: hypothetical protein KIT87_06100 [Anaerolineae bacterium]|nr:hypothetical protein [Anaerolineae bacterium]